MTEDVQLADYLAQGGKLSSPENASPRYRGELMRLMATFVDSEMAGAAGFASCINDGPGIKERIAAARIVAEKLEHADQVLRLMGDFGADTSRYANHHPWAARLERFADIGASRSGGDMRLNVFHYPIEGWIDAVVMNVLMGLATMIQLEEFAQTSYQPLGEAFRAVLAGEARHTESGLTGLRRILQEPRHRERAQTCVDYWYPRVAASFGTAGSARFDAQRRFGLRHTPNEDLADRWRRETADMLAGFGLTAPAA